MAGEQKGTVFWKLALTLLLLGSIGFLTIDDAGISSDEEVEVEMVKWNIDLIRTGTPIPSDLKHYGAVFNASAEVMYRLARWIGFFDSPATGSPEYRKRQEFLQRIKVKHIWTFLFGLIACSAAAGITGILAGPGSSHQIWIVPLVLSTFPRFWGHSFFNPKDVPFAAMMTVGTYGGICLLRRFDAVEPGKETGLYLPAILYGLLVALVTGVRIGGFVLLFFVPSAYLLIRRTRIKTDLIRFIFPYSALVLAWALLTVAIHPASWANPALWFKRTVEYLSAHQWGNTVLFAGNFVPAESAGALYIPQWFLITTPLLWQALFLTGMILIPLQWKRLSANQQTTFTLLLLQIFFLPLLAIIRGSTIYDEIRQFLFILPAIAVLCSVSVLRIYEKIQSKLLKILAVSGLCVFVAPVILDMWRLHPYEYCYFNRAFGGLKPAQGRYETDYWGLSMRAGMEWINREAPAGSLVVSSTRLPSSKTFAKDALKVILLEEYKKAAYVAGFYYVARPRWDLQKEFADCPVVYEVRRQEVPLTIVRRCP